MIIFIAKTEKTYFSLEELHEFIGIIVHEQIYFVSKDSAEDLSSEKNLPCVFFTSTRPNKAIPEIVETHIERKFLYVDTDILGIIADSLSRSEEETAEKDRYGRMPLHKSLAYEHCVQQFPYLDRLALQFKEAFISYLRQNSISFSELSPWNKPVVCLTHDVDSIKAKSILRYSFWVFSSLFTFNKKNILLAYNKINALKKLKEDPDFSFSRFADIEESYGFKSTFFVMSLPFFLGREGRRYSLKHRGLEKELTQLKDKGWEIALHPSRIASKSKIKLKNEMQRLSKAIGIINSSIGVRNHYLAGTFPQTWQTQEELGIKYDSTVGWSECSGFRAGTAKPYRPFSHLLGRRINLWEIPLITMDGTLSGNAEDIFSSCKEIANKSFKYQRPYTMLWHTNRLNEVEYPEFYTAYVKLLQHFSDMGCIAVTANDLIEKYKFYSDKLSSNRQRSEKK